MFEVIFRKLSRKVKSLIENINSGVLFEGVGFSDF